MTWGLRLGNMKGIHPGCKNGAPAIPKGSFWGDFWGTWTWSELPENRPVKERPKVVDVVGLVAYFWYSLEFYPLNTVIRFIDFVGRGVTMVLTQSAGPKWHLNLARFYFMEVGV